MRTEPEILGRGRIATVYDWGGGRAAKVFHTASDNPAVAREAANMRAACALGLPAPRVYETIEWNGEPALVMDRVEGRSFVQVLMEGSDTIEAVGARMAEIHFALHARVAPDGLTRMPDWLAWRIRQAPDLDGTEIARLIGLLDSLGDGDRLCHNDFHPDNLLRSDAGDVVIDWCDTTVGNPWADVARTVLVFECRSLPPDVTPEQGRLMNLLRGAIGEAYAARYRALAGVETLPIRDWRVVVAASRLWLPIREENELNRVIVRAWLDGVPGPVT